MLDKTKIGDSTWIFLSLVQFEIERLWNMMYRKSIKEPSTGLAHSVVS